MATVGIIVNPHAGKDIRRLLSSAGHTSDSTKIGIVRRVIAGASEAGAERILLNAHRLTEQAASGLDAAVELVDGPGTGSRLDTVIAAEQMWKEGTDVLVALGGDGTCRDVASGWSGVPLVAVSTGTNNVYPSFHDGTTAGVAAALVATGAVAIDDVSTTSPRVVVQVSDTESAHEDSALVEVALVDAAFVGARAVTDPERLRWVVACVADPAATGLAGIAGRVHPVTSDDGVLVRLGPGGRRVRVPLSPGSFTTVGVRESRSLPHNEALELPGGGVLAYDGERTTPVGHDATIRVTIDRGGPLLIDVDRVMARAAADRLFDLPEDLDGH